MPNTKQITVLAGAMAALLLFASCGTSSGSRQLMDLSKVPPSPAVPIRDELIVPGHRVGPISLGMSLRELYAAMGNPTRSFRIEDQTTFYFEGVSAVVLEQTQRVHKISVSSSTYATREDIRVGSSELGVRAVYGTPSRNDPGDFCYANGIGFGLNVGTVNVIHIWAPGC